MKFAVGFQLYDQGEEPFSEIVKTYKDRISEVFFSWQDTPSGRSGIATRHGATDWTAQSRMEQELKAIKAMGVKLDLLFNGNCYGEYAISEKLANMVGSLIDHLNEMVGGVDIVTTTSPAIAHTVRKHFPQVSWEEIKEDWYDQDFLYIQKHPGFRAFRAYLGSVGFVNRYMDFFAPDAFDNRREYITSFYLQQKENLDREYPYLTEKSADEFVDTAVSRILARLEELL